MGVDLRKQLISPREMAGSDVAGEDKKHNGWLRLELTASWQDTADEA